MAALKKEPSDMDTEPFFGTNSRSPSESSPYSDTASSAMGTPLPVHFLGDGPGGCDMMVVDPVQEEVVFLPHRPPSGRSHSHRMQGVTEYANYSISHLEAEVNSKHLPKKYRCRFCVYKTSYKSDLNRHLKKHGIALQHCPLCNMPFKTAGNLENHIGQVHSDVVRNMGSSTSSTLSSKEAFASSAGRMDTPPAMTEFVTSDSPMSVEPPDRDPQAVQYGKDFPALSTVLESPHQLHCHMCPFVSNDAQVLARHILTHPGEEEASRTSQAPEQTLSVPRLMCSLCGVTLLSAEELHEHRHSCIDGGNISDPSKPRKSAWSLDGEKAEPARQSSCGEREAGSRFGLPRQETMDRLKRAIINQSMSRNDGQTFSATRPTFPNRKDKTSMVLPHVPASRMISATADQSPSMSDQATTASPAIETVDEEEVDIVGSCVDSSVCSESQKRQTRNSNRTVGRLLSTDGSRSTSTEQEQAGLAHPSSGEISSSPNCSGLPEHRSQKRQQLSSQYFQPGRTLRSGHVSFTKKDTDHPKEPDHIEPMSGKQLPACEDSYTARFKPSEKGETHMFAHDMSIKEEPQSSPDASTDLEESENTCETDSKSSPKTVRSDLATEQPRCDTRKNDCSFCGQLFKGRIQLMKHMRRVHVLASEQALSSAKASRTGFSQHQKISTQRAAHFTEDGGMLSRNQNHCQTGCTVWQDNKTTATKSTQRQVINQRVVPQPPSTGRYAVLVSDFDEFASKPYACSLCFFRTGHLSKLSVHVHHHLTGGSSVPPPASARFQSKEPVLVERGTSPFKDSEIGLSLGSMTVSDAVSTSAVNAGCGDITAPKSSCQLFDTVGQLDTIGSQEVDQKIGLHEVDQRIVSPEVVERIGSVEVGPRMGSQEVDQKTGSPAVDQRTGSQEFCQRIGSPETSLSIVSGAVRNSVPTSRSNTSCGLTAGSAKASEELYGQKDSPQTPENISLDSSTAKDVPDNGSVSACLGQIHLDNESKHSDKLVNHMNKILSDKTLPEKQKLDTPKTTPNLPLRDFDLRKEHTIQGQPTTVAQENISLAPSPNLSTGKSKKPMTLKRSSRSSKKSSKKKSQLRVSERKLKHAANFKSRFYVRKKASMIKKGFYGTKTSAQNYPCAQCKRSFSLPQVLARHKRHIHVVSSASLTKDI